MTIAAATNPELADSPCSVAECLDAANRMGSATVSTDPGVGAPPDFLTLTLGLPLCAKHAHLLRMGCILTEFSSGI